MLYEHVSFVMDPGITTSHNFAYKNTVWYLSLIFWDVLVDLNWSFAYTGDFNGSCLDIK